MDFIYLFRVLLKRKWLIIGAAILAAAIAWFFTRGEQKLFKSSAQFSTGFTTGVMEVNLTDRDLNDFEAGTQFNNVIVTMVSPAVTSLLSYKLMLHDLENPDKAFLQLNKEQKSSKAFQQVNLEEVKRVFNDKLQTMSMLNTFKPEERKLMEFLQIYGYDLKSIAKNLNVYRVQSTDFIQADYISHNPELSAYAVNSIFEQYVRYNRSFRGTRDQAAIDTLQNIVEKKRQELDAKNAELRANGITLETTGNPMDVVAALEIDKANESSRLTELQFELQDINQRIQMMGGSSSSTTTRSSPNEQIIMARKAKNEAYQAYLANPADKTLETKYNTLNAEYERLLKLYNEDREIQTAPSTPGNGLQSLRITKGSLENKIKAAQSKIGQLNSQINQQRGRYAALTSKSATAATLINEAEQANKEYITAKSKLDEASTFTGTGGVNKFNLVVPGQPAIDPEPSKRIMIIGMAGAAAMITTMLILIFLAYMDSSIKTPAIFARTVGLKLISMVNFTNLKGRNLADIVANRDKPEDAADKKRNNIFRESLRKLRYEIETSGKKIFLFTSTKKGQGKTTIITALSYSMSLSKKKILIIDTNFCNNDLTIQLNADPILEKIVPYKADGSALLEQVKVFSKDIGVGTVYAIGSEGGDYTPSEVLPRENLLHHLQQLTTEFDYIFLEGPPLNDFSDSLELSQYVEGVIAVFSANLILKQTDKQSISFFRDLNGKFCGSVLNMVDLKNVDVA